MKRAFSIFVTIGQVVCVYFGWIKSEEWAANLIGFYSWFSLIIMIAACRDLAKAKRALKKTALPVWFSILIDISTCLVAAATGRFFYAGVWAFVSLLVYEIHYKERDNLEAPA